MTLEEFTATLEGKTPPAVSPALVALWHDGKGDWNRAHEVAQDVDDETGAWVHAYLHRKEGDESNAAYLVPARRPSPSSAARSTRSGSRSSKRCSAAELDRDLRLGDDLQAGDVRQALDVLDRLQLLHGGVVS